ncbi:hypothetical protein HanXRQr2_Chr09g0380011 [Helianthus annuus]|uniref:Uncharacterized protein n=1 Tax=Helianthus annuus TaxID=4232 RepID=A0A251TTK2_HELAN|nr:hypothetical protein HanXRQr2_Chr09g0380011 [Helianthus annuus]
MIEQIFNTSRRLETLTSGRSKGRGSEVVHRSSRDRRFKLMGRCLKESRVSKSEPQDSSLSKAILLIITAITLFLSLQKPFRRCKSKSCDTVDT